MKVADAAAEAVVGVEAVVMVEELEEGAVDVTAEVVDEEEAVAETGGMSAIDTTHRTNGMPYPGMTGRRLSLCEKRGQEAQATAIAMSPQRLPHPHLKALQQQPLPTATILP